MNETAENQWQLARKVFEEAVLRPAEERRSHAERLCGANETLWDEVRSLLDWHERSDSFLETPAVVRVVDSDQRNDQLVAGQRLLHYEIQKLIGMGGMGEVYLAWDTRLHRNVAVKLLRQDLLPQVRTSERLFREARAAALLEHPNICHIYEVSEADGFSFIVMQYVVGTTLDELLADGGVNGDTALDLAGQIADGLAEAHSRGIIHRDIKPANIIVSEKGQAKILDFGLAKFIEAEGGADAAGRLLSTGGVMGTVPYMSPEQLQGLPVDARTDVFSFGTLLFEMLSGASAFSRERNAETISAILHEEPNWLLLSPVFRPLVQRSLAKDPTKRYASAGELADELTKVRKMGPRTNPARRNATNSIRLDAATEQLDVKTTPIVMPGRGSDDELVPVNRSLKPPLSAGTWGTILASAFGLVVLLLATSGYFYLRSNSREISKENNGSPSIPHQYYWELADNDKREFIRRRVTDIQKLINDEQRPIDDESLEGILQQVDWYVNRRDSLSQDQFKEGLRFIYGRASQYVPLVSSEFEKANVPAAIGIYQAMLESEYRDCAVNPNGPVGLFQFTQRTAALYDLKREDLCKVDKQSSAAARYMSDLSRKFGSENSSWTLPLLSFQQGEEETRDQLEQLGKLGVIEQNYWAIAENRQRLEPYLESSDNYILRFFAAAIIGETPEMFGLVTPPLSTIRLQSFPQVTELNQLVNIPGGTFIMGRNGIGLGTPEHEETVSPFRMDRTEVTDAEYYEFINETGYHVIPSHWENGKPLVGEENYPVRYVNIDDINAFAAWRSKRDAVVYRLPTEQEWEFAARNGANENLYPWGDWFNSPCLFIDSDSLDPKSVGSISCPNDWGVEDLIGNVSEWTSSDYWSYPGSNATVRSYPKDTLRMTRGGRLRLKGSYSITSASRSSAWVGMRTPYLGFRLVTSQ